MGKNTPENLAGLSGEEIDKKVRGWGRRNLDLRIEVTPENQAAVQDWLRASGLGDANEASLSSDDASGSTAG